MKIYFHETDKPSSLFMTSVFSLSLSWPRARCLNQLHTSPSQSPSPSNRLTRRHYVPSPCTRALLRSPSRTTSPPRPSSPSPPPTSPPPSVPRCRLLALLIQHLRGARDTPFTQYTRRSPEHRADEPEGPGSRTSTRRRLRKRKKQSKDRKMIRTRTSLGYSP